MCGLINKIFPVNPVQAFYPYRASCHDPGIRHYGAVHCFRLFIFGINPGTCHDLGFLKALYLFVYVQDPVSATYNAGKLLIITATGIPDLSPRVCACKRCIIRPVLHIPCSNYSYFCPCLKLTLVVYNNLTAVDFERHPIIFAYPAQETAVRFLVLLHSPQLYRIPGIIKEQMIFPGYLRPYLLKGYFLPGFTSLRAPDGIPLRYGNPANRTRIFRSPETKIIKAKLPAWERHTLPGFLPVLQDNLSRDLIACLRQPASCPAQINIRQGNTHSIAFL